MRRVFIPESIGDAPRAVLRLVFGVVMTAAFLALWSSLNGGMLSGMPSRSPSDEGERLPVIPLASSVPLTSDSSVPGLQEFGFGTPESDGTWIVSQRSRLAFEVRSGAPRLVELQVYPFLADRYPEREFVVSSSVDVVSLQLPNAISTVRVRLDGEARQALDIFCDPAISPLDEEISLDQRRLCVKILSITISEAT